MNPSAKAAPSASAKAEALGPAPLVAEGISNRRFDEPIT